MFANLNESFENFIVSSSRNLSITATASPAFSAEITRERPELAITRYLTSLVDLLLCLVFATINFLPLCFHF